MSLSMQAVAQPLLPPRRLRKGVVVRASRRESISLSRRAQLAMLGAAFHGIATMIGSDDRAYASSRRPRVGSVRRQIAMSEAAEDEETFNEILNYKPSTFHSFDQQDYTLIANADDTPTSSRSLTTQWAPRGSDDTPFTLEPILNEKVGQGDVSASTLAVAGAIPVGAAAIVNEAQASLTTLADVSWSSVSGAIQQWTSDFTGQLVGEGADLKELVDTGSAQELARETLSNYTGDAAPSPPVATVINSLADAQSQNSAELALPTAVAGAESLSGLLENLETPRVGEVVANASEQLTSRASGFFGAIKDVLGITGFALGIRALRQDKQKDDTINQLQLELQSAKRDADVIQQKKSEEVKVVNAKVDDLAAKLAIFERKYSTDQALLEGQVEDLREAQSRQSQTTTDRLEKNSQLTAVLQERQTQQDEALTVLSHGVDQQNGKMDQLKVATTQLGDKLSSVEKATSDAGAKVATLEQSAANGLEVTQQLRSEVEELAKGQAHVEENMQAVQNKADAAERQGVEVQEQVSSLQSTLEEATSKIENTVIQTQDKQKEQAELISGVRDEVAVVKQASNEAKEALERMGGVDALLARLDEVERKREEQVAELQEQLQQNKEQIEKEKAAVAESWAKMAEVLDKYDTVIESHSESLKELHDRDAALKILRSDFDKMESDKEEIDKQLQERTTKVSELQSEVEFLRRTQLRLNQQLTQIQEQMVDVQTNNASLLEEKATSEQQLRSVEESRASIESRLATTAEELLLAKQRADGLENQLASNQEALHKQVRTLNMQLEMATAENKTLKEEVLSMKRAQPPPPPAAAKEEAAKVVPPPPEAPPQLPEDPLEEVALPKLPSDKPVAGDDEMTAAQAQVPEPAVQATVSVGGGGGAVEESSQVGDLQVGAQKANDDVGSGKPQEGQRPRKGSNAQKTDAKRQRTAKAKKKAVMASERRKAMS